MDSNKRITDREALEFHASGQPGKLEIHATRPPPPSAIALRSILPVSLFLAHLTHVVFAEGEE